jgi:hypothetical protein
MIFGMFPLNLGFSSILGSATSANPFILGGCQCGGLPLGHEQTTMARICSRNSFRAQEIGKASAIAVALSRGGSAWATWLDFEVTPLKT